jgi:hypothetical protein
LIFERLGDGSIVEVLKKLMKLPWDEAEPYLLKCLLKVNGGGGEQEKLGGLGEHLLACKLCPPGNVPLSPGVLPPSHVPHCC